MNEEDKAKKIETFKNITIESEFERFLTYVTCEDEHKPILRKAFFAGFGICLKMVNTIASVFNAEDGAVQFGRFQEEFSKFATEQVHKRLVCLNCGMSFRGATEMMGENDVACCGRCRTYHKMENGNLRQLTNEEAEAWDPSLVATGDMFGQMQSTLLENKRGEAYVRQIQTMMANGKRWRREHPDKQAEIRFNKSNEVLIVTTISKAIEKGMVSANEAGLELIKALWPNWDDETEPSVIMVRVALELDGLERHEL